MGLKEEMFCFQCQETLNNSGCKYKQGMCGKWSDLANLQNTIIELTKGISAWAVLAHERGIKTPEINHWIPRALFATITNAGWSEPWFVDEVKKGLELKESLCNKVKAALEEKGEMAVLDDLPEAAVVHYPGEKAELIAFGRERDPRHHKDTDEGILKEWIVYCLKGMSAYGEHAANLGYEDEKIWNFMHKALALVAKPDISVDALFDLLLETGKVGVDMMALLQKANTETYGEQEPTDVNLGVGDRPGILVSGHDLRDLEEILIQSEGQGIDVYTHGEMLPANAYPKLKKFSHLKGNYGASWWHQKEEFETFNGPIILTTNCLVPPAKSYLDRLYTTGSVSWEGAKHIPDRKDQNTPKDFSGLIEHAKKSDPPQELETGTIPIGYGTHAVLANAEAIIDAVKKGTIKRFVVMGGCDGRHKERDYFTKVAEQLPKDTVILTAGCAKFRYNKLDLGKIGPFPRVLDAGQCNDCYGLASIALALVDAFGVESINDLPLSFDIAWYEQKAELILVSLLALGVKRIHLGPTLPGFLNESLTNAIVEKFGLQLITSPEDDINAMMQGK